MVGQVTNHPTSLHSPPSIRLRSMRRRWVRLMSTQRSMRRRNWLLSFGQSEVASTNAMMAYGQLAM